MAIKVSPAITMAGSVIPATRSEAKSPERKAGIQTLVKHIVRNFEYVC